MRKSMSASEFKKLTLTEKIISNVVVSMSGGWELFKEKSEKIDLLRENLDKGHVETMKKLKNIKANLSKIDSEMLEMDKNKTQFLGEDLQKILKYLTEEKHLDDDQLFDIFEKKNITLVPIEDHPNFENRVFGVTTNKLSDQEFKILVNELYELRETKK